MPEPRTSRHTELITRSSHILKYTIIILKEEPEPYENKVAALCTISWLFFIIKPEIKKVNAFFPFYLP